MALEQAGEQLHHVYMQPVARTPQVGSLPCHWLYKLQAKYEFIVTTVLIK